MSDTANSDKVSLGVTALMTAGAAAAGIWAQQGPGFTWDGQITRWIDKTIPGLAKVAEVLHWPVGHRWVFSSAIALTVILLGVLGKRKAAIFVLASVAGCLLLDGALGGLKMPLAPVMDTLYYGTFFGGISLGLHSVISKEQRGVWWTLTGLVLLASGFAAIGTGVSYPISAWAMSVLMVASWLLIVDQLMR